MFKKRDKKGKEKSDFAAEKKKTKFSDLKASATSGDALYKEQKEKLNEKKEAKKSAKREKNE